MPKSDDVIVLDISCPLCGADLETYCYELSGARPNSYELQAPCPHCQEELVMCRADRHWEVEAA